MGWEHPTIQSPKESVTTLKTNRHVGGLTPVYTCLSKKLRERTDVRTAWFGDGCLLCNGHEEQQRDVSACISVLCVLGTGEVSGGAGLGGWGSSAWTGI